MPATRQQLSNWAHELQKDEWFCGRYLSARGRQPHLRRNVIGSALDRSGASISRWPSIEDREQLRRYFDVLYNVSPDLNDSTFDKYDHVLQLLLLPEPQPKKAKSAMDRNLAALLRSDAKTVHVKLLNVQARRAHTYVSHLPLAVGDTVVVQATGETKIGTVEIVDDEVKIEPGCDTEFYWVIDKIDMAAFKANKKRNDDIVAEAAVIVRENMRKSFAAQVLGAASGEQRDRLLALTGNNLSV